LGQLEQMYAEDANCPERPKQGTLVRYSWDKGTRGTRKAKGAESQSNLATCLQRKEGQGSPSRVDQRNLSQT
ncbi:hypothetical protein KI387_004598, partial [Taxus chinensis]